MHNAAAVTIPCVFDSSCEPQPENCFPAACASDPGKMKLSWQGKAQSHRKSEHAGLPTAQRFGMHMSVLHKRNWLLH